MLPFLAGAALKLPSVLKAAKRFWKPIACVVVAGVAVVSFINWRDNLIQRADDAGYARAMLEYEQQIEAANKRSAEDQRRLDSMSVRFAGLGALREQEIVLKLAPITERIKREIASNARYRDCLISDGMRKDLNASRATVDSGISASNPR